MSPEIYSHVARYFESCRPKFHNAQKGSKGTIIYAASDPKGNDANLWAPVLTRFVRVVNNKQQ